MCVCFGLLDKAVAMNAKHPAKHQNGNMEQSSQEDLDIDTARIATHPSADTVGNSADELTKRIVYLQLVSTYTICDRSPRRRWAIVE